MDLAATFTATPGIEALPGLPNAWHWSMAPGFDFSAALSADGKHAFQSYALDCYDEDFARALLVFARAHEAELIVDRPFAVAEGFGHPGYGLDIVVAVAPGIHGYQDHDPDVHQATRALFPAYRCEISGAEDEVQAAYRYGRAPGVQATRWKREPRPYLRMRHRAATGREIRKLGFAGLKLFRHELTELPEREAGFVEFENYRRDLYRVTWQDTYVVAGPGETRRIGLDELLELTEAVLYGPNRVPDKT